MCPPIGSIVVVAVHIASAFGMAAPLEVEGLLLTRGAPWCRDGEPGVLTCEDPWRCIREKNGPWACCAQPHACVEPKLACAPRPNEDVKKVEAGDLGGAEDACVACTGNVKVLRDESSIWPESSIIAITGSPVPPPTTSDGVEVSRSTAPTTTYKPPDPEPSYYGTCIMTRSVDSPFSRTSMQSYNLPASQTPGATTIVYNVTEKHPKAKELSGGTIGGICVGIAVVAGILALVGFLLFKRHKKRKDKAENTSRPGLLPGPRIETPNRNPNPHLATSNNVNTPRSTLTASYHAYSTPAHSPNPAPQKYPENVNSPQKAVATDLNGAQKELVPPPSSVYSPYPSTPTRTNAISPTANGNISPPSTSMRTPKSPVFSLYPQPRPIHSPIPTTPSKRVSTNSTVNWPFPSPRSPTALNRSNSILSAGQQRSNLSPTSSGVHTSPVPGPIGTSSHQNEPSEVDRKLREAERAWSAASCSPSKKLKARDEFAPGVKGKGMTVYDFIKTDNEEHREMNKEMGMDIEVNETGTVIRRTSKK